MARSKIFLGAKPQAVNPVLTADPATFTLLGIASSFRTTTPSDVASFTLSGQDITTSTVLDNDPAAFDLTGQATLFTTTLDADPATFDLTLVDAQLAAPSDVAAFTLSGQDAIFRIVMPSDGTAFVLTGQDAGLTPTQAIMADAAAFTLTGQNALFSTTLLANTAEFLLTGQDTLFTTVMLASGASFTLSGQNATEAHAVGAGVGAFTLAAQDVLFRINMLADVASYTLTGQDAASLVTQYGPSDAASFTFTGQDTLFNVSLLAGVATFTLTGQAAIFSFNYVASAASFTLTGQTAILTPKLVSSAASFTLTGQAISFHIVMPANVATYTLTGQASNLYPGKIQTATFEVIGWDVGDGEGVQLGINHIYLIRIHAHDGNDEIELFAGTDGYTSAPTDDIANQLFPPRVRDPGNIQRSIGIMERSSVSAGNVVIASGGENPLDDWINYGFGNRDITIWAQPRGIKPMDGNAYVVFNGKMRTLRSVNPTEQFEIELADALSDLELPLLTERFAGTTLSTGDTAEGDANLAAQIKQRCYGAGFTVPLQAANPFDLIYLVSNNELDSATVYDGGVALVEDSDHASIAALRAATILPGHYATCLALGLIRVGATPAFNLTADFTESGGSNLAADRTAAQIVFRMMTDFGISPSLIDTEALDALDALNSAVCYAFINDETTLLDAVQQVLQSIGGWILPDEEGIYTFGRFEAPSSGGADRTYDANIEVLGQTLNLLSSEIPVWRLVLEYARCHFVQNDEALAGIVEATERAFYAVAHRTVVAEDATVKDKHLDAREIKITTNILDEGDAQDEVDRLLAILKEERKVYSVEIPLERATTALPGRGLTLEYNRLGMDSGKDFLITARADKFAEETAALEIYG